MKQRTLRWEIPESARHLIRRVLTVGHGGVEHRSKRNTIAYIRDRFVWKGMCKDVEDFVQDCILCAKTTFGERIPRKMASILHAEHCNELVHFDFLYMHHGVAPYLLLVKDDFSGFALLFKCGSTDVESVV